jgi:hypothetical protein
MYLDCDEEYPKDRSAHVFRDFESLRNLHLEFSMYNVGNRESIGPDRDIFLQYIHSMKQTYAQLHNFTCREILDMSALCRKKSEFYIPGDLDTIEFALAFSYEVHRDEKRRIEEQFLKEGLLQGEELQWTFQV